MFDWYSLPQRLRKIVNTGIRLAKSRRREEIAFGLAAICFLIGSYFNKWLPGPFQGFIVPWRGDVIFPVICFAIGLGALTYAIYRIWKLVFVADLPPPANRPSAIKGPLAFAPSDGQLFRKLGREDEIRKLFSYVKDDQVRMVVLMGASGAGKTSLLRAGLTDILKNTDIRYHYWEAVPSESGSGLLTALQQNWGPKSDEDGSNRTTTELVSLDELVNSPPHLGSHVIVLDQFEQLGTATSGPVFRLLSKIAREAKPPHRITWIVAFRREYRANWSDFIIPEHERLFFPAEMSLKLFTSEQARDVTGQLVQAAGISVEQKVINNLIEAATLEGEVSSVDIGIGLLILSELYERQGAKTLTEDIYHFAGGAEGLLTQYINRCLDTFVDEDRKSLLSAMLALRDAETDQRIAQGKTIEELATEIEPVSLRRLKNDLERLAQRDMRLLERINATEGDLIRYRLPHERLIPALNRLAGKLIGELEEAQVRFAGAFAAWKSDRSSKQYLLRGRALRLVDRYKARIPWGSEKEEKLDFLRRSKRQRTIGRTLAALGLFFVVTIFGLEYWYLGRNLWQNEYPAELTNYQQHLKILELDAFLYSQEFAFLNSNTLEELHVRLSSWGGSGPELAKRLSKCPNLKSLVLQTSFINNQSMDLSSLPKSLDSLSLEILFGGEPAQFILPDNLTKLTLNLSDTKVKEMPRFQNNLTDLAIDLSKTEVRTLLPFPDKLKKLALSVKKTEVETIPPLPNTLTDLTITVGESNISELPALPDSLDALWLDLSSSKVKELPVLPGNLKKLTLILSSNVAVPSFPSSLSELSLSLGFNQMERLPPLPANLTKLSLPLYERLNVPPFPKDLKELNLTLSYGEMVKLPPLPKALSALSLNLSYQGNTMESLPPLPSGLTSLSLNIGGSNVKELPQLPDDLSELSLDLSNSHIKALSSLPGNLTKLTLNISNSKVKELPQLPNSLAELTLSLERSDVQAIPLFPNRLKELSVNVNHSKVVDLPPFPSTLTELSLRLNESTTKLPSFLSLRCQSLLLGLSSEQRMSLKAIPDTVTHLKF